MASFETEKFARFIISALWNRPIEHHDLLSEGRWRAPRLQELQAALAEFSEEQKRVVRDCVVEALNTGIHGLLVAMQEAHDLGQGIEVIADGVNIADTSDGLQGELYGEDGWIAKYGDYPEID